MPLFICDLCECIENTALGHYWGRDQDYFGKPELRGKALCSECSPAVFGDGSVNTDGGRWHGRFEKRRATPEVLASAGFMNRDGGMNRGETVPAPNEGWSKLPDKSPTFPIAKVVKH